jgi:hypothetical protein
MFFVSQRSDSNSDSARTSRSNRASHHWPASQPSTSSEPRKCSKSECRKQRSDHRALERVRDKLLEDNMKLETNERRLKAEIEFLRKHSSSNIPKTINASDSKADQSIDLTAQLLLNNDSLHAEIERLERLNNSLSADKRALESDLRAKDIRISELHDRAHRPSINKDTNQSVNNTHLSVQIGNSRLSTTSLNGKCLIPVHEDHDDGREVALLQVENAELKEKLEDVERKYEDAKKDNNNEVDDLMVVVDMQEAEIAHLAEVNRRLREAGFGARGATQNSTASVIQRASVSIT